MRPERRGSYTLIHPSEGPSTKRRSSARGRTLRLTATPTDTVASAGSRSPSIRMSRSPEASRASGGRARMLTGICASPAMANACSSISGAATAIPGTEAIAPARESASAMIFPVAGTISSGGLNPAVFRSTSWEKPLKTDRMIIIAAAATATPAIATAEITLTAPWLLRESRYRRAILRGSMAGVQG